MAKAKAGARSMKGKVDEGSLGGFTIIEVVLVLAIAGLIFLMVFIALPALQRSQRDTQRRDDLARVTDAITQFQTNNNGRLPKADGSGSVEPYPEEDGLVSMEKYGACTGNSACVLIKNYLNSAGAANNEFKDPDGFSYGLKINKLADETTVDDYDHTIYMYTEAYCDGETAKKSNNARDYVVMYKLEGSGTYCQDNGGGAAGAAKTTD